MVIKVTHYVAPVIFIHNMSVLTQGRAFFSSARNFNIDKAEQMLRKVSGDCGMYRNTEVSNGRLSCW